MFKRATFIFLVVCLFGTSLIACGGEDDVPITAPHMMAIALPHEYKGHAFLFASNRFLDKVFRVNLNSLDIDEVNVGANPKNIAVSPDGSTVVVVNEHSANVTIIDTMTLAHVSVRTGLRPLDVQFSPDGKWFAVANFDEGAVSLFDTRTYGMQWIEVGSGPISLDFHESSEWLAVANYISRSVSIVDVQTGSMVRTLFDGQLVDDYKLDPQVIKFGRPGTSSADMLFVGYRNVYHGWASHFENQSKIAVIRLSENWMTEDGDSLDVEVLQTDSNPRGLLLVDNGERILSINHFLTGDIPDTATLFSFDEDRNLSLDRSYVVGKSPIAVVKAPGSNLLAVACKAGDQINLIDLDTEINRTVSTKNNPNALAFSSDGQKVVVVHDSPLMPISVIDVESGTSKVVKDSISIERWID
jgi:DNA-binding beta-propeller fold protein YncE